ncbi:anhydro-N-acetylmuramic acid kinase [Streptomyces sp. NPDC093225]|uniref:anhydro-N-acetylmuramic acid kinase n=1 Tax=Streptomyces sp. NPDC093225 TaxID=3366034 RepID=UPI0038257421
MRVIGLMSGTSYDAVDAAAADLAVDGGTLRLTPLGALSRPYPADLEAALVRALPPGAVTMADVCRLDTGIGRAFADVAVLADRELCGGAAELIASHGQTVYHWADPDGRVHGTLQLGQPAWIAEASGLPVAADFRPRDVAAGGQGAPLVGLVDRMWLRGRPGRPVALNIGGIANITAVRPAGGTAGGHGADGDGSPRAGGSGDGTVAFDTGPGNALIDAAVRELTDGRRDHDEDGRLAAAGAVHEPLLRHLLAEPYYRLPAPRTTGKELFNGGYLRAALHAAGLDGPDRDVVATLTLLTARTIADAVRPLGATEVVASGGGVRNPVLMDRLRRELPGVPVRESDGLGLPAQAKEAYAFAVLGFLTALGLPGNAPACTGAAGPRVLGSLTPGRRPLRLPPTPAAAPHTLVVTR